MSEVYICPGCGKPIEDGQEYVTAREYQRTAGVGRRDLEPDALADGPIRRFHPQCFRQEIGDSYYELGPDDA